MMKNGCMDVPCILVESPMLLPSVRVGVLDVLGRLEKQGRCRVVFKTTFSIKKNDVIACDILVIVRGCETMSLEVARVAKKMGRFLIYYLDDDLLNLPENAISSEYYQRKSIRNNIKELIKLSDVFWSNNEKLIEKYAKYGESQIRSVRTDIISKVFSPINKSEGKTKTRILYAGSIDHTYLVEKYVLPAVSKIVLEYDDKVEVVFIGVEPKTKSEQIKIYKFIDNYDKYKDIVLQGDYDIGLAAIATTEFYQCKYYNKFLEYTSIGAVGVYTDSFPYKAIVENQKNGILVDNTVDSWYEGIKSLVDNPQDRKRYLKESRDLVASNFNETYILECLERRIPEFFSFKAKQSDTIQKIHLKNGRVIYFKQRLMDFWREDKVFFLPNVIKAGIGVLIRYVRKKCI